MAAPLPGELLQAAGDLKKASNFKLLFERYLDAWDERWSFKGEQGGRFMQSVASSAASRYGAAHELFVKRWKAACGRMGAVAFTAVNGSRLAIGLGNETVLENGMTLHPVLGFPYIPGSSLKGCLRNWYLREKLAPAMSKAGQSIKELDDLVAREMGDDGEMAEAALPEPIQRARRIFGSLDQEGEVIFYDAIPLTFPALKADIMNPHFTNYYEGKDAPGDWMSPNPIKFLTVDAGAKFFFAIMSRSRRNKELEQDVRGYLEAMLAEYGVGAKTAVGYGWFKDFADETERLAAVVAEEKRAVEKHKMDERLAALSPAERLRVTVETAPAGELGALCSRFFKEMAGFSEDEKKSVALAIKNRLVAENQYMVTGRGKDKKRDERVKQIMAVLGEA